VALLLFAILLPMALMADDDPPGLTADDVKTVIQKAAEAIDSTAMVIAVTNRQGDILGVFRKPDAPATSIGNFGRTVDTNELAVGLARTGAFFSNNQAPLSSRTVRFISGIHFPPGIMYTGNAPPTESRIRIAAASLRMTPISPMARYCRGQGPMTALSPDWESSRVRRI
jgi:hypothetical protein